MRTWHRVVTFGGEGTEPGNFCRPWGVAIARYSDLSTVSDPWFFSDQETSATSASSSDTFNEWFRPNLGMGFGESATGTTKPVLINPVIGSNNNNNNNDKAKGSAFPSVCSTYLIGIADRSNNRIQMFKFDAICQTVTFSHMFGEGPGSRHGQFDRPAGIVFNPRLEQVIVADKDNHRVQVFGMGGNYLFKFGERGSKCGQFCYPWDIDICKTTQNIVVSDTRNRRIQMFNNLGRYLMHYNQPLDSPRGVSYLNSTQIMVSDFNKHRLLLITQVDEKLVTSSTSFISSSENNYLTSNNLSTQLHNNPPQHQNAITRLPQINNQQQKIHESKFVGFGEGSSWGEFLRPQGVTSNGSLVYCADSRNNRVAYWNKETQTFNYISRDVVEVDRPAGLAAIDNYIVIVDFGNNRVHICQRVTTLDNYPFEIQVQSKRETCTWRRVVTFGAEGTEPGNFCRPWGVAIARYSDLSNVSDPWFFSDQETSATSASSSDTFNEWFRPNIGMGFGGSATGAAKPVLINPVVGSNNNNNNNNDKALGSAFPSVCSTYLIGIADRSNNRIQMFKFDAIRETVTFSHMFGEGPGSRHGQFDRPAGIVFNPRLEQIIVADKDNHRVQVFGMGGNYLFKFGERGSKCGQFCYPWDIDICKTTQNIVVSDTRNRRIQMFNNLGRYLMHYNQPLDSPRGVSYLNPTQIMVSDFNKHRLLLITQVDEKLVTSSTSFISSSENNYLSINHLSAQLHNNPPQQQNAIARLPQINHHQQQKIHESKFVGFGEGSSWGEFLRPQGVTSNGSLVYCADSRNNRVAYWNKETQTFNYISRDVVEVDRPAGLAAIDNYIVIVDFGNNRVHICERSTSIDNYA